MRRVVITGCGRTGSQFTSQLLGLAGFRCQHEQIYNPTLDPLQPDLAEIGRRWEHEHFEVSWMAAPFLKHLDREAVVFHQIRDPLKTLRCWAEHGLLQAGPANPAAAFVHRVLPECGEGGDLERAVAYLVLWSRMAMEQSWRFRTFRTFRVEDFTLNTLMILLDGAEVPLGVQGVERCRFAVDNASRTAGKCVQPHRMELIWQDVRRCRWGTDLHEMAKKWGYCDS